MIPGPGHYNVLAEHKMHRAHLRKASKQARFNSMTAAKVLVNDHHQEQREIRIEDVNSVLPYSSNPFRLNSEDGSTDMGRVGT